MAKPYREPVPGPPAVGAPRGAWTGRLSAARWAPAAFALFLTSPVLAQQASDPAPCRQVLLRGRVTANQSFDAPLSPSLTFRLDADTIPANPPGWTIRVTPPDAPDRDHAMIATPPYRFWNPRYVDTGYGVSAAEALANTPRDFAFVATDDDFDRGSRALDVLLWSYSFTDSQVDSASAAMDALRVYPASFTIENGEASEPSSARPLGRIEWMSFRLDACIPDP
jgi:hypothetical protein